MNGETSIVTIHIDNMCVAASSKAEMARLKHKLRNMFDLVDLGGVHWLLGIAMTRDRKKCTISLSQHAYIKKIAKCFDLENMFPISTPLDPNVLLSKEQCPKMEDEKHCMKTIPYLLPLDR